VLIHPAERMNAVTANALLKTLEEPAGDLLFILSSEASHQLLPTVRSRCQSHRMLWPEPAQAKAWLQGLGAPAADAAQLLDAAGQRPLQAMQMAESGMTAQAWAAIPKALAQGRTDAFDQFAGAELVGVMQKVAHDLWLVAAGAEPRFFAAQDLPPCRDLSALQDWTQELNRQARVAEHPFSAGLYLQALVARGQRAVNSRP
jgi:DNA polymerase III subunit delta'